MGNLPSISEYKSHLDKCEQEKSRRKTFSFRQKIFRDTAVPKKGTSASNRLTRLEENSVEQNEPVKPVFNSISFHCDTQVGKPFKTPSPAPYLTINPTLTPQESSSSHKITRSETEIGFLTPVQPKRSETSLKPLYLIPINQSDGNKAKSKLGYDQKKQDETNGDREKDVNLYEAGEKSSEKSEISEKMFRNFPKLAKLSDNPFVKAEVVRMSDPFRRFRAEQRSVGLVDRFGLEVERNAESKMRLQSDFEAALEQAEIRRVFYIF